MAMMLLNGTALLTLALITYFQFRTTIDRYNQERILRKEKNVLEALDYVIGENNLEKNTFVKGISSEIFKISNVNNIDIRIYSLNGKLLESTISNDNVKAQYINERIYKKLSFENNRIQYNQFDEKDGSVRIASYSQILDYKNEPLGIVNMIYGHQSTFLVEAMESLLMTLGIMLLFLLLASAILAWYLSKQLTQKLYAITDKIKKTDVISTNLPIEYYYDDELKPLVNSYNAMVEKLQVQTHELTKLEREDAWREMAKQVAHEIKNPLTPMKLLVQNFQLRFNPKEDNAKEKVNDLVNTLTQQIDTITEITEAFSDYAKMPHIDDSEIDLVEVTKNIIHLFSDVSIDFQCNKADIIKVMDNIYYSRIVTNLLKNAIQSVPSEREIKISIELSQNEKVIVLKVKDNGTGIAEDIQNKIFEPKFTTKNSGMGLGLAMIKKIVDDYNGSIWFESEENKGTIFFVEFPND